MEDAKEATQNFQALLNIDSDEDVLPLTDVIDEVCEMLVCWYVSPDLQFFAG